MYVNHHFPYVFVISQRRWYQHSVCNWLALMMSSVENSESIKGRTNRAMCFIGGIFMIHLNFRRWWWNQIAHCITLVTTGETFRHSPYWWSDIFTLCLCALSNKQLGLLIENPRSSISSRMSFLGRSSLFDCFDMVSPDLCKNAFAFQLITSFTSIIDAVLNGCSCDFVSEMTPKNCQPLSEWIMQIWTELSDSKEIIFLLPLSK